MEQRVVVLGGRSYVVERPFGVVDPAAGVRIVSSVAVAIDGSVHVLQRSGAPVLMHDPSGALLRTRGEGRITDGHIMAFGPDGLLWVVDRDAHEVVALDGDGAVVRSLGVRHRPIDGGVFNHPSAVAERTDGHVLVADGYGNSLVHVFDAQDRLVHVFGGPGLGPGRFSTPHGILIDRAGRIVVTDRENDRVQVFDEDGTWREEWVDVYRPMDVAEDADGGILVTDQVPRLSRFVDGVLVGRCRTPAIAHGVAVAADGTIYLAEPPPSDRVTRLVPIT